MDDLANEETHARCAEKGRKVVEFYRALTQSPGLSDEEALTDLIADLMHLAAETPSDDNEDEAIDFEWIVSRAERHFEAEV